ncbi:uncharacterized protein KY384_003404 [Bacidia gigantensis]|uniref:uncharacterized protein n=1 Tax=Bacidia gigantensis TaxID=2732470 RepID=UPI001D05AA57|nr:uncharacterized protein KY384_003404 [Bacidia gigantensis]KAG8531768.1 hypothetical protein KY384_003404 [Bacidia gigantensis]
MIKGYDKPKASSHTLEEPQFNGVLIRCDGEVALGKSRFEATTHDPRKLNGTILSWFKSDIVRMVGLDVQVWHTDYIGNQDATQSEQAHYRNDDAANLSLSFCGETTIERIGLREVGFEGDGEYNPGTIVLVAKTHLAVQHVEFLCHYAAAAYRDAIALNEKAGGSEMLWDCGKAEIHGRMENLQFLYAWQEYQEAKAKTDEAWRGIPPPNLK